MLTPLNNIMHRQLQGRGKVDQHISAGWRLDAQLNEQPDLPGIRARLGMTWLRDWRALGHIIYDEVKRSVNKSK